MTDKRRPKRESHRRVHDRREGSIRRGDRRVENVPVEVERRSGFDRRDAERRDEDDRRSGNERRRKEK